jgi:hypothetical protein
VILRVSLRADTVVIDPIDALEDAEDPGHVTAGGRCRCLGRGKDDVFEHAPVDRVGPVATDGPSSMYRFDDVQGALLENLHPTKHLVIWNEG